MINTGVRAQIIALFKIILGASCHPVCLSVEADNRDNHHF